MKCFFAVLYLYSNQANLTLMFLCLMCKLLRNRWAILGVGPGGVGGEVVLFFFFLKEVEEFLYHWVKPATCNGFSSTIIDSHIWEMVQLRVLSFVNISH